MWGNALHRRCSALADARIPAEHGPLVHTLSLQMDASTRSAFFLVACLLPMLQGCAAATSTSPPLPPPTRIDLQPRIVTASEVTTEPELATRAERALMEQRWADAVEAYRTLLAADPDGPHAADYSFDLGLALEGTQERAKARDTFLDLARRFPDGTKARASLVRAASLDAYLEDWAALAGIGDTLLARGDLEDVDRLVALGSRGLARVELGEDTAGSKDIFDGLELSDQLHYGARDVLPVAVAELRFALGELRRVRSEKIVFDPVPDDFLDKLEERCGGLLEAQAAYALAVRSIDPHWAAMGGYRVGEMYRVLHRDLMQIPPPARSKTARQKQIFYAFMHIRYRVLLEKGLKELEQTIALGERTADSSPWIQRARDAKREMQTALDDEKAQIAKMPFTEDEVKLALELEKKKTAPKP
jgi:tetratricopeptide (TPR) repeat protein